MMSSSNYHEQIEDYLDNQMSPEDKAAFETLMNVNPQIANEVALFKEARERIRFQLENEAELNAFQNQLSEVMEEPLLKVKKRKGLIVRRLGLGAVGVAAAIILLVMYWRTSNSLYEQYNEHPVLGPWRT